MSAVERVEIAAIEQAIRKDIPPGKDQKRALKFIEQRPFERHQKFRENAQIYVDAIMDILDKVSADFVKEIEAGADRPLADIEGAIAALQNKDVETDLSLLGAEAPDAGGTRRRPGRRGIDRQRAAASARPGRVFRGVTEQKKVFRINEDGSVSRIDNEEE